MHHRPVDLRYRRAVRRQIEAAKNKHVGCSCTLRSCMLQTNGMNYLSDRFIGNERQSCRGEE